MLIPLCIIVGAYIVGYMIDKGLSQVALAIRNLESCIQQFAPKSETKRTLDFMREVGFGEPKD